MNAVDALFLGLLVLLMIPVVVIDLRERRIPNLVNLAIAAAGLVHALWRDPRWFTIAVSLGEAALVLAVLVGTSMLIRLISPRSRIGWGDLKFLAAASLWVGPDGAAIVLLLASLGQLGVALAVAPWRGLDFRELRPFGPMLACSLLLVTFGLFA